MKKKNLAIIYLFLTFTLWGSLYVVSKYVLGKLPTFTISFIRFFLAFLFLTLISFRSKEKLEQRHIPHVFCIGFVGYFLSVGAQLLGTKYTGASIASLLNSLNPVTMTLFGMLLLHEKITISKAVGIVCAIFGVYITLGGSTAGISLTGILFSLFSVVVWSFVSVLVRKVTAQYNPLFITRLAAGIAAACYLPVAVSECFLTDTNVFPVLFHDPSCIISLLYMGILCTGGAYMLWNKSLSVLEANICSAFYPIQPLVSTLLGVLFLSEKITPRFFIGALFIAIGILLNLKK